MHDFACFAASGHLNSDFSPRAGRAGWAARPQEFFYSDEWLIFLSRSCFGDSAKDFIIATNGPFFNTQPISRFAEKFFYSDEWDIFWGDALLYKLQGCTIATRYSGRGSHPPSLEGIPKVSLEELLDSFHS